MTNCNKPLVSIDIFDTAIFRRYYKPDDLLKSFHPDYIKDFYDLRKKAENKARELKPHYNLDDIYHFMPLYSQHLQQKEIEEEVFSCYANPEILEMYNKQEADYIFISDMYLSSAVLEIMLEQCGYENPTIFVSCECDSHKADGSLFKYAEKELGRHITKHYGDNYVADVIGARKANIEPVFKPALHQIKLNLPPVKDSILKKYLAATETDNKKDRIQKLACWYTPIMLKFTDWILNKRQDALQGIFFVSRDMFIPYLLAKYVFNATNIHYIHASRRSLAPISLKCEDKLLRERIKLIYSQKEIDTCLDSDTSDIEKYFANTGIKNGDIFADIGYAGTIQYSIEKLLNIRLKGLYLQTIDKLVKKMNTEKFFNRETIQFCLLVEFPFCSPENNVIGYDDGKPLFSEDSKDRRNYSVKFMREILSEAKKIKNILPDIDVSDLEQILIHIQYYADDELMEIYNRKIFSNREEKESIIGYDRSEIAKGNLFYCFDRSYSKPLFKKMLAADKEYSHLSKLLEYEL